MNIIAVLSGNVASGKLAPHDAAGTPTEGEKQLAINKLDFAGLLATLEIAHLSEEGTPACGKEQSDIEAKQKKNQISNERSVPDTPDFFSAPAPIDDRLAITSKVSQIAEKNESSPPYLAPISIEQLSVLAGSVAQRTTDQTLDTRSGGASDAVKFPGNAQPPMTAPQGFMAQTKAEAAPLHSRPNGSEIFAEVAPQASNTSASLVASNSKAKETYTHKGPEDAVIGQIKTNGANFSLSVSKVSPPSSVVISGKSAQTEPASGTPLVHRQDTNAVRTHPAQTQAEVITESPPLSKTIDVSSHNAWIGKATISSNHIKGPANGIQDGITIDRSSSLFTRESLLTSSDNVELFTWDTPRTVSAHHGLVAPSRTDLTPHIARQLGEGIIQAAHKPTEIVLSPAELGRVRMSVISEDGKITVNIVAERPDTLDLMRRHIDQLGQTLRTMGYEQISFSFGQGTKNNNQAKDENSTDSMGKPTSLTDADSQTRPKTNIIQLDHTGTVGVDIRL
jgi:flagellar hook-length control protein FliK